MYEWNLDKSGWRVIENHTYCRVRLIYRETDAHFHRKLSFYSIFVYVLVSCSVDLVLILSRSSSIAVLSIAFRFKFAAQ